MSWSSSATTSDDVYESLINHLLHLRTHRLGSLIILTELIRESCIRVTGHIAWSELRHSSQVRHHSAGTHTAVQTYRQRIGMHHRSDESLNGLSAEQSATRVTYSHTQQQFCVCFEFLFCPQESRNGSLGIQGVEDSLYKDSIHPFLHQRLNLFYVVCLHFVEGDGTCLGHIHILAHGEHLICRSHISQHISWALRSHLRHAVSLLASQSGTGTVYLPDFIVKMIFALRNPLCTEGICGNDVSASLKVLAMQVPHRLRLGYTQSIVIA